MLEQASGYREDVEAGRWIIETRFSARRWEVVVELLPTEQTVIVVTAYPTES